MVQRSSTSGFNKGEPVNRLVFSARFVPPGHLQFHVRLQGLPDVQGPSLSGLDTFNELTVEKYELLAKQSHIKILI